MTYELLLAQRAELDKQIAETLAAERAAATAAVCEVVAKFSLTSVDIFGPEKRVRKPHVSKGKVVAIKYRDTATGDTWTGRGFVPKWLIGKNRDDYLVA